MLETLAKFMELKSELKFCSAHLSQTMLLTTLPLMSCTFQGSTECWSWVTLAVIQATLQLIHKPTLQGCWEVVVCLLPVHTFSVGKLTTCPDGPYSILDHI